jgi:hypothetical protein
MMPAYNFKRQFAPRVKDGTKRTTIRRTRKRPTRPGDTLYHYVDQRLPTCEKLLTAVCTSVQPITIVEDRVVLNGEELPPSALLMLAMGDGFASISAFRSFFRDHYGLPTEGLELIAWERLDAVEGAGHG